MNPFDLDGRNGKESYLLRRVARQRLDEALARRATYAAALVTALVERIGERQFRESTVERLWATIQSNLERHQSQVVIDSQTGAYGEFRETVRAAFARVEREQREAHRDGTPSTHHATQVRQRPARSGRLRRGMNEVEKRRGGERGLRRDLPRLFFEAPAGFPSDCLPKTFRYAARRPRAFMPGMKRRCAIKQDGPDTCCKQMPGLTKTPRDRTRAAWLNTE